jgi:UDP-N-acetylmuramate: L-alanyl-gamma-D-glutamyl-meso-diaminopimelate ligase
VIEADEYDTAFCDKRSKFVHYRPRTAVLNNLEFDHADIFADLAAIETQFHHLVRTLPANGLIVANAREAEPGARLARGCWTPVERSTAAGWEAVAIRTRTAICGLLARRPKAGRASGRSPASTTAPTRWPHLLAARHVGRAVRQGISQALSRFRERQAPPRTARNGARRNRSTTISPTTRRRLRRPSPACAARSAGSRILAVLEPRSNTMKLGAMKAQLPASLADADATYCYAAQSRLGCGGGAGAALAADAREGDQILVMSNGGFGGVHDKLLAALAG